jgi:hypothetical protein
VYQLTLPSLFASGYSCASVIVSIWLIEDDPDTDPEDVFDGPPEELQAATPPVSASPVATTATRLMMLFLINCAFLSLCDRMMKSRLSF